MYFWFLAWLLGMFADTPLLGFKEHIGLLQISTSARTSLLLHCSNFAMLIKRGIARCLIISELAARRETRKSSSRASEDIFEMMIFDLVQHDVLIRFTVAASHRFGVGAS
jgi:hypothetical protein